MEDQIKATIASANQHVLNAYNKLEEMGATMPDHKNIQNLKNTIYTLPLDVEKVTVSFDAGEGSPSPAAQELYPGQTVAEPVRPTKEGCIFLGWYKSTGPQTYTVTFQADGATNVPAPQTVAGGGVVSEPEPPVKSGYQFNYWELNGQQYDFSTPVTQDITLVANFTAIYTVTFDASGGTPAPAPQQVLSGQTVTQPANPSKTGYTFNDWNLNGTAYNFSTPVTSDITLVASYVQAYDPANPQLSDLKAVLATDNPASIYPVGTEIPDTYNGNSNPLIVAQYLDSSNNSSYGGAQGVILIRKYALGYYKFAESNNSRDYNGSYIQSFLNGDYYNSCSAALKSLIAPISIKYYMDPYSSPTISNQKAWLMSATEVGGTAYEDGIFWDYWKQKTGLTEPSQAANSGRRIYSSSDASPHNAWLRTGAGAGSYANYILFIENNGQILQTNSTSSTKYVLPACFVSKS